VAVSVDNLDETLARLKQEGVRIISGPRKVDGLRSAFIEAPDTMELEIVEGQARR
jgi:catechol 2,3-dioxygenase-like lactoylglutathione lyase family enzyme